MATIVYKLIANPSWGGKTAINRATCYYAQWISPFSTVNQSNAATSKEYKFVVAGAGSGGMAMASALCRTFGKGNVAVIEPADTHFYQPMWTLVGGGIKKKEESGRPMSQLMPQGVDWFKDKVEQFDPDNNLVKTTRGDALKYDFLVVAIGFQLRFNEIKGLSKALEQDPMVCCNYSYDYVDKTFEAFKNFRSGNAIFTQPATPVKCPGAAQKVMYLAHDYFRRNDKLKDANIIFNQGLPKIFGVPKYAAILSNICKERNIELNLNTQLVEVVHDKKEAIFQKMDKEKPEFITFQYDMMHVTPKMTPPDVLQTSPLAGPAGFMTVNKTTGQHTKYPNVLGIGDCTDIPTSKTTAAVAAQTGVLKKTLQAIMNGQKPEKIVEYDGYTSCPLITGYSSCVLAEFNFNLEPLETFPFDQGKERRSMFHLKKDFMPFLYWNFMVKGLWNGPGFFRKLLHLGFSK